jgi:hypothetical protein
MAVNREAIYAALFARLQAKLGSSCKTYSRKELDFEKLGPGQCPALLCFATSQPTESEDPYLPAEVTLKALVVIFVKARLDDPTGGETPLNTLVSAVDAALENSAAEGAAVRYRTTLGELVKHARVQGTVEILPGAGELLGTSAAMIPIEMLAVS